MARSTADLVDDRSPSISEAVLNVVAGLEVVEQVKLQMVDDRGVYFVSVIAIRRRWRTNLVFRAIQNHAGRSHYATAPAGSKNVRIDRRFHPHFVVQRAHNELPDG